MKKVYQKLKKDDSQKVAILHETFCVIHNEYATIYFYPSHYPPSDCMAERLTLDNMYCVSLPVSIPFALFGEQWGNEENICKMLAHYLIGFEIHPGHVSTNLRKCTIFTI